MLPHDSPGGSWLKAIAYSLSEKLDGPKEDVLQFMDLAQDLHQVILPQPHGPHQPSGGSWREAIAHSQEEKHGRVKEDLLHVRDVCSTP